MRIQGHGTGPVDDTQAAAGAGAAAAATPAAAKTSDLAGALSRFKATGTTIFEDGGSLQLTGPLGVDVGATIKFDQVSFGSPTFGKFLITTKAPVGGPSTRELDRAEKKALVGALEAQEKKPAGLESWGKDVLKMMVKALKNDLAHPPSKRFEGAKFLDAKELPRGGLVGHLTLADGKEATISATSGGKVTIEEHAKGKRAGTPKDLSHEDREGLAAAASAHEYKVRTQKPRATQAEVSNSMNWALIADYAERKI